MNNEATNRIRLLPPPLIKKIAAGEVVERPASVIKELLDNALDAGASRITLTIEDGGRRLMRVTDNGCGMDAEELQLSVLPHTTSKLHDEEDLFNILTMGFRGEALASISSIARLRVVSRAQDAPEGHEIQVVAEDIQLSQAAGCPPGTSVEVRDLFFNVPARRKFMRTAATETGHINEQLTRAALANPQVAFELVNNGRTTQQLPATESRRERIAALYGPEVSSDMISVHRDERGLILEGYAGPPAKSRASTQWQYTFVNGRFIRDRFVQHALREAYRGLIDPHRHGMVFLFLQVDPRTVDVNVHPTKIEVRWADGNLIHSQVLSALREALQRADLSPNLSTRRAHDGQQGSDEEHEARKQDTRRQIAEFLKATPPIVPGQAGDPGVSGGGRDAGGAMSPGGGPYSEPGRSGGYGGERDPARTFPGGGGGGGGAPGTGARSPSDDAMRPGRLSPNQSEAAQAFWRSHRRDDVAEGESPSGAPSGEPGSTTPASSGPYDASGTPAPSGGVDATTGSSGPHMPMDARELGAAYARRSSAIQMHNLYLVAETDDGIAIIDQHALHERIMYEELRTRMMEGALEAQHLLLPETLPVSARQASLVDQHAELLGRLGIQVSAFGPDTLAVNAFPSLLKDTDVVGFMRDLLDHLELQPARVEPEAIVHDLLDMMACKAAVKAGDPLTQEEIDTLIARKDLVEKSSSCPHGRPTMLKLTKADLERQFKRT
jgi:DNA mismatch repair protein MutL